MPKFNDKPYDLPSPLYCRGCERPCRSKAGLASHERICPKLRLGQFDSFFKRDPLRTGYPDNSVPNALRNLASVDNTPKFDPPSQELALGHAFTRIFAEPPVNCLRTFWTD